jgi:hypothetical protein
MEGVQLRQIDMDYRCHLQAYLNFAVRAEKKKGKGSEPVFKKFKQFYNYKAELEKVKNKDKQEKSRFSGIGQFLKKGE